MMTKPLNAPAATSENSPNPPAPPDEVPNYDFVSLIGTGGFGQVWLARERITGTMRAVKLVRGEDETKVQRETDGVVCYQKCARDQPHLLQILTVGRTDAHFYYVMEIADNALRDDHGAYEALTLRKQLESNPPMDGICALQLVEDTASGVAQLHKHNLAHHDIKPENILIVNGRVKVADVGLVDRNDRVGQQPGTRPYMTPEGTADDGYALGKILYEAITKMPPNSYPLLPADFFSEASEHTQAALRIANRACEPDPQYRFRTLTDFRAAIGDALTERKGLFPRFLATARVHPIGSALALVLAVTLIVALGLGAWSSLFFHRLHSERLDLTVPGALPMTMASATDSIVLADHSGLFISGSPLPRAGVLVRKLEMPSEFVVVDFHIRCIRPAHTLHIGVSQQEDRSHGFFVGLGSQPDGMGLRTIIGRARDRGEVDVEPEDRPILWHPQPGIEYVIRLARLEEEMAVVVWPMTPDQLAPEIRKLDLAGVTGEMRHLWIRALADDPRAEIHLLDLRVESYSHPLSDATDPPPAALADGPFEAFVPPIPPNLGFPEGDILTEPFHPYDSNAWSTVGGWSFCRVVDPGGDPRAIQAIPFSTSQREHWRDSRVYDGCQLLRFDRAQFGDFEAELHIRIPDPEKSKSHEPFPAASQDGSVGLVFRWQDASSSHNTWGGGLLATVQLSELDDEPGVAELIRFGGLGLTSGGFVRTRNGRQLTVMSIDNEQGAPPEATIDRETLFAPGGFTLSVKARGSRVTMLINDVVVLAAEDQDWPRMHDGRIALYANRLMPEFLSLTITPLRADD